MDTIPEFPTAIGEGAGITFLKDGQEYRLMRYDDATWLIHKSNTPADVFQLVLTPVGATHWDLSGRSHMNSQLHASYTTPGQIFTTLF